MFELNSTSAPRLVVTETRYQQAFAKWYTELFSSIQRRCHCFNRWWRFFSMMTPGPTILHRIAGYIWQLMILMALFASLSYVPARAQSDRLAEDNGTRTTSTIQRIRNRGNVLIVGVSYDYPPFGYLDEGGTVTGFEPDLMRALADQWGVDITFVPVTASTRVQSLLAGQVDLVVATLPHTTANEALVDFGPHYFTDATGLLLNSQSQAVNLAALAGKTVATVQDDHAQARLNSYLNGLGITVSILPFQEHTPALRALQAEQADALLADQAHLAAVAGEQPGFRVIVPLADEHAFGFGIAPGDSYFRNLVDATFQQLYGAGVYAEIHGRWFPGRPIPMRKTLSDEWPYSIDTLPATMGNALEPDGLTHVDRLSARGKLLAGVRYDMAPFGFLDATGRVQGFEIDLVRELARRWFGDADALELVRVTPDTAIPLLNAGQVDLLAAALPHIWSNEAVVDFGLNYYADAVGVLVRAESNITTSAALDGSVVATVSGTSGRDSLTTSLAALRGTMNQPVLLPFQEYRIAEQALLAGQIDGIVGSTTVLAAMAEKAPTTRLLPDPIQSQVYAIGVPQFDDEMRDLVNLTLQVMQLDGTYDAIYANWFSGSTYMIESWPGITADLDVALIDTQAIAAPVLQPTAIPNSQNEAADVSALTGRTTIVAEPTLTTTARLPLNQTPTPLNTTTERPLTAAAEVSTPTPFVIQSAAFTRTLPQVAVVAAITAATGLGVATAPIATATKAIARTTTTITATVTSTSSIADSATVATTGSDTNPTPTPTVATVIVPTPAGDAELALLQASLPATVTVVSRVNINARIRPTTVSTILAVVPAGTSWPTIALSGDGEWVQIALDNGQRGWVARRLLVEAEIIAGATSTSRPTEASTFIAEPTTQVDVVAESPTVTPTPRLLFTTTTTHIISATDSLASISQQYYGVQSLWRVIYEANRAVIGDDPNVIPVGAELVIPPRE